MNPTAIALAIMQMHGGISVPRPRYCVGERAYIGAGGPFGYGKGVRK